VKFAKQIRAKKNERGYALLLVAFAATLMLLAAMTAVPNVLTEGKREKEKEMIWRGNQYVRGIKLYYRKTGKFPAALDDLTKPQVGNIRFMRQQYKDPMNQQDGSWRLIYVGPTGQLIGSLKPQPQITLPGGIPGTPGIGTPAANLPGAGINPSANPGANGPASASEGTGGQGQQGEGGRTSGEPRSGYSPNGPGTGTPADANASGDADVNLPADTPTVIGGSIIGIGSKASGRSVIVWDKARNYRLFEFYWDPSKDVQVFGQPQNPAAPQIPGTNTLGTPVGNPGNGGFNPTPSPPLQGNPPQSNPPQN